ncbi:MAG TPA: hypothetical protein VHY08_21090 [Bacillota bacterium]|nr:hypothetical protein [Bacillota bacterium]
MKNSTKNLFLIAFMVIIFSMLVFTNSVNLLASSNKKLSGNYYGYLDTGEGTYVVIKLVFNNDKLDLFECVSDGAMMFSDYELSEKLRRKSPKADLTLEDAILISKAFINDNGVKMELTQSTFKKNKLSFGTEEKLIEDGIIMKFRFDGDVNGNKIIGFIYYKYSTAKFEVPYQIEFRYDK